MLMITLAATILFFATGGIIIDTRHSISNATGYLTGSGVCAILNGFVYLAEFVATGVGDGY
jgi:hypothetical protein